jgi:predicted methyltransferase MtxX (methanogen marker protein 4)
LNPTNLKEWLKLAKPNRRSPASITVGTAMFFFASRLYQRCRDQSQLSVIAAGRRSGEGRHRRHDRMGVKTTYLWAGAKAIIHC